MKKHLIITTYDGISTHYCGVGTTIQDTIFSLMNITNAKKIKISLAYISADPNGKVFDQNSLKRSMALVKKTKGHLISLCNGTAGFSDYDMWQSFSQWEYACASLATALNIILKNNEDNVLMLHDAPFLFFHKFKQQIFKKNLRCFYMPRSSGLNHKLGDNNWRETRIRLEKEAFEKIVKDPTSSVLAIGKTFGEHLIKDYNLSFGKKDYLNNGLFFGRFNNLLNKKFNSLELKKFGIKIDPKSKIIFSWGRASVAKGLKELLEAWGEANKSLPDYYLVVQAPNNSGENDYFKLLKKYEATIPRIIVIDDFNPKIWQTILRTQNTKVVCIPSTMDPNPHTPIEAKLFSLDMDYIVISSDLDGVKNTFTNNECLWANPYDKSNFSNTIIQATKMSDKEKAHIKDLNKKSLLKYNYEVTIKKFLNSIKFI